MAFSTPVSFRAEPERSIVETKATKAFIVVYIFLFVFTSHFVFGRAWWTGDSRWAIYTAASMIYERNTDLDEYREIVQLNNNYGIYEKDGHIYGKYPLGASVLALPVLVPVLLVLDRSGGVLWLTTDQMALERQVAAGLEVLVASLIVALTAVFIYLIGRLFLKRNWALLLTFIFAFCTAAWSTASRALWQHGPSMLMLSIALYLILRARDKPRYIQYASLPLAFSYVARPTNSISVALLSLYVLVAYRQYFLRFLIWALPVVVPFLAFNLAVYGAPLSPYYSTNQASSSNSPFFEALAGNLISPGRGLFIFSPILLLSLLGIFIKVWQNKVDKLDYFILVIIVLHWLVISTAGWAGYSFGPRLFSDMVPYFIYFLIPVLAFLPSSSSWKRPVLGAVVLLFIALSFFINMIGATSYESQAWNATPDIDKNPGRVWDWRDLQFMRWR